MAFLRVVRQGHPINPDLFVDLGPSVGRRVHTRGAVFGGEMVTGQKPKPLPVKPTNGRDRARMKAYREAAKVAKPPVLCGRWMILARAECGRTKGHRDDCMSRERMERRAEARRS